MDAALRWLAMVSRRILRGLVLSWLALIVLLWALQDRLVFPGAYMGRQMAVGPQGGNLFRLEHTITEDGLNLPFLVAEPSPGMPIIIRFHGNGKMASDATFWMRPFTNAGYGVVLAEYRGFGGAPGNPAEAGLKLDARAQIAWVSRRWPGRALVLWGESLGTYVAIGAGREWPAAALVLDSPCTSIREIAQRKFPFVPVSLLLRNPFDSLADPEEHGGGIPAIVMSGGQDIVVPPDMGHSVAVATGCRNTVELLFGQLPHVVKYNDRSGKFDSSVFRFLEDTAVRRVGCLRGG